MEVFECVWLHEKEGCEIRKQGYTWRRLPYFCSDERWFDCSGAYLFDNESPRDQKGKLINIIQKLISVEELPLQFDYFNMCFVRAA